FVDTGQLIDLKGFYREFKRTIGEELDYLQEAANARRFREMFADTPGIRIPAVHDAYVSRRVLVLEWVDGIKVNDYAALDSAGVDRLDAAKRIVEAYLYQFFQVGFFHADPHPGNIFVQPGLDGAAPTIAFVDFGMVGSLTKGVKQGLKDLFLGFVVNNAHTMAGAMQRLGFIGEGANMAAIERGIGLMVDQYQGLTLGQVRDMDLPEVVHEIEDLLYTQPFRIPAEFAFSGKAVGTVSGVATGLAPNLNLIDVAAPYARRFLNLSRDGAGEAFGQLPRQLMDASRTLLTLPAALERVLTKFETGQIEVRVADGSRAGRSGRRRRSDRVPRGEGGGLASASIFAASAAGGVVLTLNHFQAAGWFCLALAAA
ncbi:MAG: AarF/ABC1/UbiB kinase family protein, partial [Chloroflexota bacterium]|nr:AarF/ABC1/UbiB kinase family protein [Chloroflexota bacterium]